MIVINSTFSRCEFLNANLALAIDIVLCPKDIHTTADIAHQLLERWILTYEPARYYSLHSRKCILELTRTDSASKTDLDKPLPKALEALTFLIRSLGGYAGSMPLHALLKDPSRFGFLYGTPSPSCTPSKEPAFDGRYFPHYVE